MALLKAKIVVIPLGDVDFLLVNKIATNIGPVFNRSVDILKGMKVPQESYNVIRGQQYASVILNKLERVKASQREFILGLLEEDIYLPDEAFIIGHSDSVSKTALVSLHRIRHDFYGLPENENHVYSRVFKQSIFQLAPLFNLTSCRNPKCVLYYSQNMMDIDNKKEKICDLCKRKLTGKK